MPPSKWVLLLCQLLFTFGFNSAAASPASCLRLSDTANRRAHNDGCSLKSSRMLASPWIQDLLTLVSISLVCCNWLECGALESALKPWGEVFLDNHQLAWSRSGCWRFKCVFAGELPVITGRLCTRVSLAAALFVSSRLKRFLFASQCVVLCVCLPSCTTQQDLIAQATSHFRRSQIPKLTSALYWQS
jgi:hypothetical protein